MAKSSIYSISNIILSTLPSDPPQLSITVQGMTTTAGWTQPELVPLEQELSPDNVLDLAFIAEPPEGAVFQSLTPVTASIVIREDVDRIVGVRVVARSGDRFALLQQRPIHFDSDPFPQPTPIPVPPIEVFPIPGQDPELISELTGRPVRVYAQGDAVTTDSIPDRVNIETDRRRRILRIWYG